MICALIVLRLRMDMDEIVSNWMELLSEIDALTTACQRNDLLGTLWNVFELVSL